MQAENTICPKFSHYLSKTGTIVTAITQTT